jgi:hypothetical protein
LVSDLRRPLVPFLLSAFPVSAFQFFTVSAFARLSFSMSAFQLFSFGSVMPVSLSAF